MSYSHNIKETLIKKEYGSKEECYAEITSVFRSLGDFRETASGIVFELSTENPAFARRIFSMTKRYYSINSKIEINRSSRFKKHNIYIIRIENRDVMDDITANMEIEYANGRHYFFSLPEYIMPDDKTRKAYLSGAFLASGSISNPEKTYHMEINTREDPLSVEISKVLEHFGLRPKTIIRGSSHVVYLKESENIKDFIGIIGAYDQMMEFENIRILKEMRNNVNRIVNCETSNLDKTIDASLRQIEDIRLIEETIGISKLPEKLAEAAILRLENESCSLKELSEMTRGKISKSGISHRMRRLGCIADKIRESENGQDIDQEIK